MGRVGALSSAEADEIERKPKEVNRLAAVRPSLSFSIAEDIEVIGREATMELNNSGHDDIPAAFVRDWRIRRISPSKLINPDGAQIVRRRTVITIGSMSESKGSAYGQEDQPISASEVGETACGKISITVKTLPKSVSS